MSRLGAVILAAAVSSACSPTSSDDQLFYVQSEGALMPVMVRGNVDSGVFLVAIHGGPGTSAQFYAHWPAFEALERSFALVYWDQRAAGDSLGNAPRSTNRLDQHVVDLGVVLEAVKAQYAVDAFFLAGLSWGGRLGAEYLASGRVDERVRGWIDVDGLDGYASTYRHSRQWVLENVPRRLAEPGLSAEQQARLEETLRWHEENPELGEGSHAEVFSRFSKHASLLFAMGGYDHDPALVAAQGGVTPPMALDSPLDAFQMMAHSAWVETWDDRPEETRRLLSDVDLSAVTVPSLLIWGRHDGAIPVAVGESKLSRLTSLSAIDKRLSIFEGSGHSPMLEEAEKFSSEVEAFVTSAR